MSFKTVTKLELTLEGDIWIMLHDEAARSGLTTLNLVSDVIANWVRERHRERVAHEIAQYASAHAGSELDLDSDLEAATLRVIDEDQ